MTKHEITSYSFEELSEDAKKKAIRDNYAINVDYDWWGSTYEDAQSIGLKITGFDLDRNRHADGEFLLSANEVAANIFRDHGDKCDTYKTAEKFMAEWQPVFSEYMDENSEKYESGESEDELQALEDDFLKSLLEDYSIILQKESEYLQSEEAIEETLASNDCQFTEDGNRFS